MQEEAEQGGLTNKEPSLNSRHDSVWVLMFLYRYAAYSFNPILSFPLWLPLIELLLGSRRHFCNVPTTCYVDNG